MDSSPELRHFINTPRRHGRINKLGVIAGLDPAIHLLRKSWITGSRR
jgi:hypothetical protein